MKKAKGIVLCTAMLVLLIPSIASCDDTECNHTWLDATCDSPKTCSVCNEIEGEPLGHTWVDATCTAPKTCSLCAVTEGDPLGHTWTDATCTAPKTCSVCNEIEGEPLGHTWSDATCTAPKTCSVCSVTEGEPLGHSGGSATCTQAAVCEVCQGEYGNLDSDNHSGDTEWCKTPSSHQQVYACCNTVVTEWEAHSIVNGSCNICGFEPTLTVSTESARAGEELTLCVALTDNPGILGLELTLTYDDSLLTLRKITAGEALSTLCLTEPSVLESGCRTVFDGVELTESDVRDGNLLLLSFTVSGTAPPGEVPISLQCRAYDGELCDIPLTLCNGAVTVRE